ncbi:CAP domain-containing protein [Ruminococcaceae bacterium OttesenSCG-928-L11]|nr:CAP domain-containing protein [Ruminococcaceae bacterium OttesenSCG-928-L11]
MQFRKWMSVLLIVGMVLGQGLSAFAAGDMPDVWESDGARTTYIAKESANDEIQALLVLVNRERQQAGLPALRLDSTLTAVAEKRAEEIVERFSHIRPNGKKWYTISCLVYGENLAQGLNRASTVMDAWMNSTGHKTNILSPFTTMGLARVRSGGTTYWVQLFGYGTPRAE